MEKNTENTADKHFYYSHFLPAKIFTFLHSETVLKLNTL